MKSFLEEYGLIIVAIIIIAALIGLAIFFKNNASKNAKDNFRTFTSKAQENVEQAWNDNEGQK